MSSVNTQIQRAISDAISSQILPQSQTALNSGSGHLTQDKWNVTSERPEVNSEKFSNEKSRGNSRSEPIRDRPNDSFSYLPFLHLFLQITHLTLEGPLFYRRSIGSQKF